RPLEERIPARPAQRVVRTARQPGALQRRRRDDQRRAPADPRVPRGGEAPARLQGARPGGLRAVDAFRRPGALRASARALIGLRAQRSRALDRRRTRPVAPSAGARWRCEGRNERLARPAPLVFAMKAISSASGALALLL